MKKGILLFLFLFIFASSSYAGSDKQWNQILYDSIYFAENGNDVILDLEKINFSLSKHADPNWINSNDNSSILSRYVQLVSIIKNVEDYKKGVSAITELFKHGARLQYTDDSILFDPIFHGRYEIVKMLLDNGASATQFNKKKDKEMMPIELAAMSGYEKIIELLVNHGAQPLDKKDIAQLRLITLAGFGSIEEIQEQITKGADVNTKNRLGYTALISALSTPFYNINTYNKMMYLLNIGADVNLKGKYNDEITTPLHIAVYYSHFGLKEDRVKENRDLVYAFLILDELIKKGAFVSAQDEDGRTPLHVAAKNNNILAAGLLLNSGAKIMPKDNSGKTPLDYAESGKMIKLLKDHGAIEQ